MSRSENLHVQIAAI
jgi:hypothetical protein